MKQDKEMWVMSILSDAQELANMGYKQEVVDKINQAKKVLMGKYKDNGLTIEVQ